MFYSAVIPVSLVANRARASPISDLDFSRVAITPLCLLIIQSGTPLSTYFPPWTMEIIAQWKMYQRFLIFPSLAFVIFHLSIRRWTVGHANSTQMIGLCRHASVVEVGRASVDIVAHSCEFHHAMAVCHQARQSLCCSAVPPVLLGKV